MRSCAWESLRLRGSVTKAKAAYQDFSTLWKDADPDIPIFIAAKAEYAHHQKDGLDTPDIPLFKQFKESIEAASKVSTSKAPTLKAPTP
jgi:hypothetical protein